MSRRNAAPVRKILPDPKYQSLVVAKLINQVMLDGKKGIGQNIVYDALDILADKTQTGAIEALDKVLENVMPLVETKPRKVGGATYQVPVEVRPARRQTLAIRWLVLFAKKRGERGIYHRENDVYKLLNVARAVKSRGFGYGIGNSVHRPEIHKH